MPTPTGSPLSDRCRALCAEMKRQGRKRATSRWLTLVLENELRDIEEKMTGSLSPCAPGITESSTRARNVRSMRSTGLMRQLWLSACICDGVKVI